MWIFFKIDVYIYIMIILYVCIEIIGKYKRYIYVYGIFCIFYNGLLYFGYFFDLVWNING